MGDRHPQQPPRFPLQYQHLPQGQQAFAGVPLMTRQAGFHNALQLAAQPAQTSPSQLPYQSAQVNAQAPLQPQGLSFQPYHPRQQQQQQQQQPQLHPAMLMMMQPIQQAHALAAQQPQPQQPQQHVSAGAPLASPASLGHAAMQQQQQPQQQHTSHPHPSQRLPQHPGVLLMHQTLRTAQPLLQQGQLHQSQHVPPNGRPIASALHTTTNKPSASISSNHNNGSATASTSVKKVGFGNPLAAANGATPHTQMRVSTAGARAAAGTYCSPQFFGGFPPGAHQQLVRPPSMPPAGSPYWRAAAPVTPSARPAGPPLAYHNPPLQPGMHATSHRRSNERNLSAHNPPATIPAAPTRCISAAELRAFWRVEKRGGERWFICSVCERSFRWSSNLKRHLRVHTGERPYQCRFCAAAFTNSSNRNKHERMHERDLGDPGNVPAAATMRGPTTSVGTPAQHKSSNDDNNNNNNNNNSSSSSDSSSSNSRAGSESDVRMRRGRRTGYSRGGGPGCGSAAITATALKRAHGLHATNIQHHTREEKEKEKEEEEEGEKEKEKEGEPEEEVEMGSGGVGGKDKGGEGLVRSSKGNFNSESSSSSNSNRRKSNRGNTSSDKRSRNTSKREKRKTEGNASSNSKK